MVRGDCVDESVLENKALTAEQMYGKNAHTLQHTHYVPEQIHAEEHDCIFTQYDIFPGISLSFHDIFVERLYYDNTTGQFPPGLISIQHCRQGRFEGEYPNGERIYLGEGDLVMNRPELSPSGSFPLASYHGVNIVVDCKIAAETISQMEGVLGDLSIDLWGMHARLEAGNRMVLFRRDPMAEHIFSEIYRIKSNIQQSYLKLKTLELLMYLSTADFKPATQQPYYLRSHVQTVKKIREYLTKHLQQRYTLKYLSEEFQIPLTAMKECFKGIYGIPVQTYMRQYRMQAAAEMLVNTDISIAEIGMNVGYESSSKFTASFRKNMGITPREYRAANLAGNIKK